MAAASPPHGAYASTAGAAIDPRVDPFPAPIG